MNVQGPPDRAGDRFGRGILVGSRVDDRLFDLRLRLAIVQSLDERRGFTNPSKIR